MITNVDQLASALLNQSSRVVIDKASLSNAAAGQLFSLWRATGQPAQGAIPGTTPTVTTNALQGAIGFNTYAEPIANYWAWAALASSNSATTIELHDRIVHCAGFSFNITTQQSVQCDLASLTIDENRRGTADYLDGQWYLDVYADAGATAGNLSISVIYTDNSLGSLTNIPAASLRTGRPIALTPYITAASQGKVIRAISTVTLSAATGSVGNFGFSWRRQRTMMPLPVANMGNAFDWGMLGAPEIHPSSCLELMVMCSTTTTGTLRGQAKIAHG